MGERQPYHRREERPQTYQRAQGLPRPLAAVAQMIDVPPSPPEEPILDKIHVIIGRQPERVSQTYLKAEAHCIPPEEPRDKRLKRGEVITFFEADVVPNQVPHSDALVIRIIVVSTEIRRVYVDTNAAISIMYLSYFKKLGIDSSSLRPYALLESFTQGEVQLEWTIQLPKKIGSYSR